MKVRRYTGRVGLPGERAAARASYERGRRASEIAASVGVSEITVYKWAQQHGWRRSTPLPKTTWTKRHPWEDEARRAFEGGAPMAELCARFGKAENTLRALAKKRGWDEAVRALALRQMGEGWRVCRGCGDRKALDAFRQSGHGAPRATCRECERPQLIALKRKARVNAAQREGRELLTAPVRGARAASRAEARQKRQQITEVRRLLRALFHARCAEEGRSPDAVEYQARYEGDPAFRQRERDRQREYKHANPQRIGEWADKRKRLMALQSDGTLTRARLRALFAEAKSCPYCGAEFGKRNKTLDHLDPLSRGGVHGISNVAVVCKSCNRRKHARPFAVWVGMLPPERRPIAARLYRRVTGGAPDEPSLPLYARAS